MIKPPSPPKPSVPTIGRPNVGRGVGSKLPAPSRGLPGLSRKRTPADFGVSNRTAPGQQMMAEGGKVKPKAKAKAKPKK